MMISSYFGLEYFILFCDPSVTNISRYVIGSGKSALHPENDMTKSPASSNFSFCANGCCLIFTVKPGKFFSNSPFKYSPVFFDNSTSSFNNSNSISFLPSSFLPASQYFFASFTFGFTISPFTARKSFLSGPLMKLSGINPVAGLEPLFNNVSTNGLRSKASEIALRIFLFANAGPF
ncbi:Uncharacterised protein [Streptococcus pneumoniae]|nr:Uncharacterised protein [Streptococcus pneumoniae]